MIISQTVKLRINNRQVKYYKEKGYLNVKGGRVMEIKVSDLTDRSNSKIKISCTKCKKETEIGYNDYMKYTKKLTENYYCKKCVALEKTKKTIQLKYGCDNVFQVKEIKEKRKNTMIERYGEEHALNVLDFKEKAKQTTQKIYGVDYASQNETIKLKIEKVFMEKYGVKTSLLNLKTIEKIEKTNFEKYGSKCVFSSDIIKEKSKQTMLEKYGVEHPIHNETIRNKIEETNIKRYGSVNPMSNENVIKKMLATKKENGGFKNNKEKTEYKKYWLSVKRITNKNKILLFEKWDGYDFYDNEYIEPYFCLKSGNKNYPTVDHKISVKYGFDNNINIEEIGELTNLCVTKRSINSSKSSDNEWNGYKKIKIYEKF